MDLCNLEDTSRLTLSRVSIDHSRASTAIPIEMEEVEPDVYMQELRVSLDELDKSLREEQPEDFDLDNEERPEDSDFDDIVIEYVKPHGEAVEDGMAGMEDLRFTTTPSEDWETASRAKLNGIAVAATRERDC
jgi:hypothetical protein